ncbi:MAG: hypothetical protein ACRDGM_09935 [bacterium]
MIGVLAGNHAEFSQFLKARRHAGDTRTYRYVAFFLDTIGVEFTGLVRYGTWGSNHKAGDLERLIEESMARHRGNR